MLNLLLVATALLLAAVLAFTPRIRDSSSWKATVTPLSSIMGSGFLVSAPLVAGAVGVWAPVAMGVLLTVAFAIGAMIRFNIRHAEDPCVDAGPAGDEECHRCRDGHQHRTAGTWAKREAHLRQSVEQASHVVLAGAYVVSVSYYLQLLSAFVLDQLGVSDPVSIRGATTGALLLITAIGSLKGLRALEKVETYAVSLNLGTIAALLLGLVIYAVSLAIDGSLGLPSLPVAGDPVHSGRVVMGLLIVVQGFETSRFLGAEHPAEERIVTMRRAQLIATAIYLAFVSLMLPLLHAGMGGEVTEIVSLVAPVAVVLPAMIVFAAVASQFSAAVADDAGCAGLIGTIAGGRVSSRATYLGIGVVAVVLTWFTDVMSIISIASRAFALFYALQCFVTASTARGKHDVKHRMLYMFGGLFFCAIALSVTIFGVPAE